MRFTLLLITSILLVASTLVITAASSKEARAAEREYTVFDSRKTFPLSDKEPVYRDYYVNMGVETGVKVGSILSVYRKIPVIDIYTNKAPGDLIVEVAQLQVIQTQKSMSVGRLLRLSNPKSIPVVQFEKVMLGDRVDLAQNQALPKEVNDDDADDSDVADEAASK